MQRNPLFVCLEKDSSLDPQETQDKKIYFLLPLSHVQTRPLIVAGTTYSFTKDHLSVYQYFSSKNPALSAIHYTAQYSGSATIHFYFDERGRHILSDARLTQPTEEKLHIDD